MKRWTVITDRSAFIVYAATQAAATRKISRLGRKVIETRPRGYTPPKGR